MFFFFLLHIPQHVLCCFLFVAAALLLRMNVGPKKKNFLAFYICCTQNAIALGVGWTYINPVLAGLPVAGRNEKNEVRFNQNACRII